MITGIDISTYQHNPLPDFNSIKQAVAFVWMRSSYGTGYIDDQFIRNESESRKTGNRRGMYHYGYFTLNSPEDEARWFASVIHDKVKKGDWLWLDLEEKGIDPTTGKERAWPLYDPVDCTYRFLNQLSVELNGYKGQVYMEYSWYQHYNWSKVINAGYKIIIAAFNFNPLTPIKGSGIMAHQYSDKENIAGLNPVDADVFYGDENAYDAIGYSTLSQTPMIDFKVIVQDPINNTFPTALDVQTDNEFDNATWNALKNSITKRFFHFERWINNSKTETVELDVNALLTNSTAPLNTQIQTLTEEINALTTTNTQLKVDNQSLTTENETLKGASNPLQQEVTDQATHINTLNEQIRTLEQELVNSQPKNKIAALINIIYNTVNR